MQIIRLDKQDVGAQWDRALLLIDIGEHRKVRSLPECTLYLSYDLGIQCQNIDVPQTLGGEHASCQPHGDCEH